METALDSPRRHGTSTGKGFRVGDRVSFAGTVLRVLDGEEQPLLIMIDATAVKVTIHSHWFPRRPRGSDSVRLVGTVTRVGEGMSPEYLPVSIAVDGYTASRVTLYAKNLERE